MYAVPFPFKYAGRILLKGQILDKLASAVNDPALLSLGYIKEVDDTEDVILCDGCSRKFLNIHYKDLHKRAGLCTRNEKVIAKKVKRTDKEVISALPEQKRKQLSR